MESHPTHALLFATVVYAATGSLTKSALFGGAVLAYMKTFGHSMPTWSDPSMPVDMQEENDCY
jgi:hypothetical protein